MNPQLRSFLVQRPDVTPFVLPLDIERALSDLFKNPDTILPRPYKIFYSDENLAPSLGFPVAQSEALRDIDARLDRWLADECQWQVDRTVGRERLQQTFSGYVAAVMKAAENAMLSNLLADYHGVFWLAHSMELARQFSGIPRRVSSIDTQLGRNQGDSLKYRIYSKWALEMREQMSRLVARLAPILDGEEERALRFFRLVQENVLVFTEEFIGPDLRELKSFFTGYLHRDFSTFKEQFERIYGTAADLVKRDPVFRGALTLVGMNPDQGIPIGLMLDLRFQRFLFESPAIEAMLSREEREQLHSVSRRLQEFAILQQLRRGIVWMTTGSDGEIAPVDRRPGVAYSRATRPIDFGRPGVVDPMVHRFGLMYDISSFSETLGDIARSGRKGELTSYRQMLLFQRKLSAITERHILQFEKFLGDGAFYTTRRAMRLVEAALEIQQFYSDLRKRGFAFNKGIRIALNFGYYRLLPMKGSPDSTEHVMEFYGPGVVELSRLTTGKSAKEVEEMKGFLLSHGYHPGSVHQFFAPLARGADMIDHEAQQREFFAYVNRNGHLVNEGIVASVPLIEELSRELVEERKTLYRLQAPAGSYFGFSVAGDDLAFAGLRLIGTVSFKGIDKLEVAEIARFRREDVQVVAIEEYTSLLTLLRQDFHQSPRVDGESTGTSSGHISTELLLCAAVDEDGFTESILLGEWDARTDSLLRSVEIRPSDLHTIGISFPLKAGELEARKELLREMFRQSGGDMRDPVDLSTMRQQPAFSAFFIGKTVEML